MIFNRRFSESVSREQKIDVIDGPLAVESFVKLDVAFENRYNVSIELCSRSSFTLEKRLDLLDNGSQNLSTRSFTI